MDALTAYLRSLKSRVIAISVFAWMANLIFSSIFSLSLFRILKRVTAQTLALENSDLYGDFTVWMELIRSHASGFHLLLGQALVLVLFALIFFVFLSGGIYRCFLFKSRPTLRRILIDSWKTFPSFLKLFLFFLIVWIPVLILCLVGFGLIIGNLSRTGNEAIFKWLVGIWGLVTILLLSFSISAYDFSRIHRLTSAPSTWRAFRAGLSFARKRYGSIFMLYLIFAIPFLLIQPLWAAVFRIFGDSTSWVLLFLLHQVFIWLRYLLKALLMHAETEITRSPSSSAEPSPMLDATG